MKLIHPTTTAASVALLSLPLQTFAQSSVTNQNLTLRFLQTHQESGCSFNTTTSALTFTTSSIPVVGHCFDIPALFGGNTSQGFVNQSSNLFGGTWITGDPGIHWQLENMNAYDPQANYSSVLYRQHISNAVNDNDKPGHYAVRMANIYGSKGCKDDPNDPRGWVDWHGFSCWSEDEGKCGNTGYPIASFYLKDQDRQGREGKCWSFAHMGGSARGLPSSWFVMGSFLSTSLVIWLAL